jgi:hypothetical protein
MKCFFLYTDRTLCITSWPIELVSNFLIGIDIANLWISFVLLIDSLSILIRKYFIHFSNSFEQNSPNRRHVSKGKSRKFEIKNHSLVYNFQSATCWSELPEKLWLKVIENLRVKDVNNLHLVCRNFHQIANLHVNPKLCFDSFSSKNLENLVHSREFLRNWNFMGLLMITH